MTREKVYKLYFASFQKAAAFAKKKLAESKERILIRRSGLSQLPFEVELEHPHIGFQEEETFSYRYYDPPPVDNYYEKELEELRREAQEDRDLYLLSGETGWYYDEEYRLLRDQDPDL